jgi:hypothetical protein
MFLVFSHYDLNACRIKVNDRQFNQKLHADILSKILYNIATIKRENKLFTIRYVKIDYM